MIALFPRELRYVTRGSAVLGAALLNAIVLSWFVLQWGDGVGIPNLAGWSFHEQGQLLELMLLTLVLPWAAVRCMAPERGTNLVLLSAMTAVRPSAVMTARISGLTVGLLIVVASGLPCTLIMLRMAALDTSHLPRALAAPLAVTACAAAWGGWAGHRGQDGIAAWCVAWALTSLTVALTYGLLPTAAAAIVTLAVGLGVAGASVAGANRGYQSLSRETR